MTRLGRVCGLETEYGVTSVYISSDSGSPEARSEARSESRSEARAGNRSEAHAEEPPLSVEEAVKEIFASTERAVRVPHGFLSNGARLYIDIGAHPEYAGPECLDLEDVVAQDLAGDAIIQDLVDIANAKLLNRGMRIHALKTNADSWGNSFGCHENYQYGANTPISIPSFVSFLAARQILCGSGCIDEDGRYCFSARARYITETASADPTHHKAFINTKEEPHADASLWRRLHVTCADSAMLPVTVALRTFLADRFLSLLEGSAAGDFIVLDDPVAAVKIWNYEPNARMRGQRGEAAVEVSCPELMRQSLDLFPADDDEFGLRDVAERGLAALSEGNLAAVSSELDWSLKYQLISHVAAGETDFGGARARRADLVFHDLSKQYGLRERLLTSGNVKSMVDGSTISLAKTVPPANTRAALRGKVVEACDLAGRRASIGWAYVRLDQPPSPQIDLLNPLESESAEVTQLLEKIENLPNVQNK
ncbi:MAG: proteasome accessory factor PafA2 family protein [Mobiluncus sp.]|uniref:proteasome accessory factor PafA2 family protein n=1 Tax=Mobiluncus sp. TaxID=47293 RepID=UPI00258CE541|nr:proteasome accessory factor PafA2 family protein [Mobiluncus sp.]MCI6585100.1 proteasome accessory factor PafA2 family protein [Mobiluncus sp.]